MQAVSLAGLRGLFRRRRRVVVVLAHLRLCLSVYDLRPPFIPHNQGRAIIEVQENCSSHFAPGVADLWRYTFVTLLRLFPPTVSRDP